jgi:hypothetical protein
MTIKQGCIWYRGHIRYILGLSIILALLGPIPGHEGFGSYMPLGLLIFMAFGDMSGSLVIFLALGSVIYFSSAFILMSTLGILWGLLISAIINHDDHSA